VKLEKYGDAFLEVIKPYCEKHGLKEIALTPNPSPKRRGESASPSPAGGRARDEGELSPRSRIIAEAFNNGATIQELMNQYGFVAGTILDHLMKFVMAGNKLSNGESLQAYTSATPDQQGVVFAAFDELGTYYLKPVFDKLNGTLSYDELKVLRLLYLASQDE
jgi:ATP-dependent DNA helicase RecQ